MKPDVLIVGAGIVGASCAFTLAKAGLSVVLVDDAKPGASSAAAGMLSPSFEFTHDAGKPHLKALLDEGLAAWEPFVRSLSDDPWASFGYRRDGVYGIGYHARPPGAERPATGSLSAFTRPASQFVPTEGCVEPLRLISALKEAVTALGSRVVEGRGKTRDEAVEVAGETFRPGTIVVTAGADPSFGPQNLQGVKGEAFIVRLAEADRDAVPRVVRSSTAYFVPRADGTLYVGATEEWPGAIAPTTEELWRDAERLLPALGRAELLRRLSGFRPFIDRDGPVVARDAERSNLIRAQGHHRNGVLLAPLSAETVKRLIMA